jgi:hypothetical protein
VIADYSITLLQVDDINITLRCEFYLVTAGSLCYTLHFEP